MAEDNRLATAPILVVKRRSVLGGDRIHGLSFFHSFSLRSFRSVRDRRARQS